MGTSTSTLVGFSIATSARDQVLVVVTTGSGATVNPPNGYGLVGSYPATSGNKTVVFSHTAAAGESQATFGFPNAGPTSPEVRSIAAVIYRNVDPNRPIDTQAGGNAAPVAATIETLSISGMSASAPNDRLMVVLGAATLAPTGGKWTAPAGMTTQADAATTTGSSVTDLVDQPLTVTGTVGSRASVFTAGEAELVGVLLALRPAPQPVLFYHHVQLGSTRLLTDNNGQVVATPSWPR